jgi:hypothetical protein
MCTIEGIMSTTQLQLIGIHHVSALSARIERTHDCYTRVLGLRPVISNSGIVDRRYFTSAYIREPNGVLFELATDGPGFGVDSPLDGERLSRRRSWSSGARRSRRD